MKHLRLFWTSILMMVFFCSSSAHAGSARSHLNKIESKQNKKKNKKKKSSVAPPPQAMPRFNESALAHQLLDGKRGIEIGASIHNGFGLNTLNVDYTDDYTTPFKLEEIRNFGHYLKVDIVSPGDDLPFKDNVWDFVINSHVIEHFYDPVKTIQEWLRVIKPGGLLYMIVPHKERTFDKDRPRTTLAELIRNHDFPNPPVPDHHGHYSVWITEDFVEMCQHYQWPILAIQDVDDKVGNGFTVVIQKP